MNNIRPKVAFAHDVIMAALAVPLSMFLRLGRDVLDYDQALIAQGAALFAVIAGVVFWSMRLYGGVWRYASMNDLMAITKAVTLAILIFLPVLFLMTRLAYVPRSTPVITWFVLMVLLGGPRFLYRWFKDHRVEHGLETGIGRRVPVLLIGAGDTADLFIRAINHNPASSYRAVGLVDEKGTRIGRSIHGVHVLGNINDIPAVIDRLGRDGTRPQRLIVTKENMDGAVMRRLLEIAEELGISLARLPRMTDFRSGVDDEDHIRAVDIEDLLGRPQTVLDRAGMEALIKGRRVLVTGAGGSIGSELARQIAGFGPASLILLDSSEYALYAIDLEIAEQFPKLSRVAVIADVRDEGRIGRLMQSERPELVFHAAALKHVPMVEAHPAEGVRTNVIGTRVVADCCRANGIKAMVLISTDKAVNPTSVMGASKRIAETYCQALDLVEGGHAGIGGLGGLGGANTRFITVRFGNVLGSTGSVVPLFQRQLAAGGPLTVTHPDMKRFFMTVREAVELVLEASVLGVRGGDTSGKIYVLDMGDPVRILDLANQMILLAGLRPGVDIAVKITGPRPGEKLFEEVLHDSEPPVPTEYGGILLAAPRTADHVILTRIIGDLEKAAAAGLDAEILSLLHQNIPEYKPGASAEPDSRAAALS